MKLAFRGNWNKHGVAISCLAELELHALYCQFDIGRHPFAEQRSSDDRESFDGRPRLCIAGANRLALRDTADSRTAEIERQLI
jgi:hypothetical protein